MPAEEPRWYSSKSDWWLFPVLGVPPVAVAAVVTGLYVGLIFPTRNPLSSPALSLDRLHVQFGQDLFNAILISPADRDRFLTGLAEQGGMKRVGDRLCRT